MRLAILAFGLCASLAVAETATAQRDPAPPSRELGLPFFDVFDPRDYRGHMQVWSAVQDAAGLIYFGNYGRVLVYDGARWEHLEVPGTSFVRALAIDKDDVLWIGAVNELGYAATDATGRRTFTSLRDKLPAEARDFGELWRVVLTPRGPLFQSNSWLLRWDGEKFITLALERPGAWQLASAGGTLWVSHGQKGWFTLTDNGRELALTPFARPPEFAELALNFAVPGDKPGEFLFGTARGGLLRWDGKTFTRFPTAIDETLKAKRLYRGTRLPDGRLALATLQGGAFVLDAQGRLLAALDEEARLPDNGAISTFAARDGSVWVCLQRGMVRVDARPWLTWFGAARGAPRSTLQAPQRFHGELFTCSDYGLLRLVPGTDTTPARLSPVPEIPDFLNGLVPANGKLVGFSDTAIFDWPGVGERMELPGRPNNVFGFNEAPDQPGRWFAQLSSGLTTYRYEEGQWIFEGPIPGLVNVRSVSVDSKGLWWMGTPSDGVMMVTFPHATADSPGLPEIKRLTAGHGLPEGHGWARVSLDDKGPLLRCERGFFRFNEKEQRFEPTAEFGPRFADGSTTARSMTSRDRRDGMWIAARPAGEAELVTNVELGVAGRDGWRPVHLPQLAKLDDVASIDYEEADDVLWVSVHGGMIRLDLARWREAPPMPAPVVVLRGAETDGGARLSLDGGWQLPYARRAIHLTFASPALAGDATGVYESTLLGGGDPIVLTDGNAQREFSALASGDYRVRLRARRGDGQWSAPVEFGFTVLPPWWRSGWAWAGYGVLGMAAVFLFVRSRTRTLQRRAEQLEAIVAARTEELRKSNAELVRLHRLELDEKIAARLAEEKARLEVLRYQLNPHFLFNALTSVCAELPVGSGGARAIIERLTDFCQLTLFRPANDESPTLGQEMKMLTAYLDIEKTRWGDLLHVDLSVAPPAGDAKIPSLLLLPLVENALKYGQATTRDQLKIRLAARIEADGVNVTNGHRGTLAIEIANTGHWVEPTERGVVPSLGIGHENLKQRLQRYYPGAHEFSTESKDGWVTVRLRLKAAPRE